MNALERLGQPRWRGQPGRLEVWYATFTAASGDGFWIHSEIVSPKGGGEARCHGWIAAFPTDAAPQVERFGPHAIGVSGEGDGAWYQTACDALDAERWLGRAANARWDLAWRPEAPPLYTFPRWAWERELLPGAQIVAAPLACFDGTVQIGDRVFHLDGARGAFSRIYGHGNAERWGWLHADLGGGDVLEVVAAASRTPGIRRLGVRPILKLRLCGEDWPRDPLLASLRFRARIGLPVWEIEGSWGGRSLRARIELPPQRSLALAYEDPDGAPSTCTNSERASAWIQLCERGSGARESVAREWHLDGTAHAEVGIREPGVR